jgi:hypothetical protein
MDFLQLALIFLIALLSVFLTVMGIQVFFILKDLKKGLDRFNNMLASGEQIAKDVEKPIAAAVSVVEAVQNLAQPKPKSTTKPKFYKKLLK